MRKRFQLECGAQIGVLYKDFYTDKNGQRKIRYIGYIFLGIFGGEGIGLEIRVYPVPASASWNNKPLFRIKSGRRCIGWFVKEERRSEKTGKFYHFLKGKIDIGGLEVRINAFPDFKTDENAPDYKIELATPLEIGILKLS
jgi:uncharacterized protein (DUF736 family)